MTFGLEKKHWTILRVQREKKSQDLQQDLEPELKSEYKTSGKGGVEFENTIII